MKTTFLRAAAIVTVVSSAAVAQERIDRNALARIRDEGMNRSKVMETSSWLTDVYGPRLTNSPTAKQAGDWAINAMRSWGITSPRYEAWDGFGRGWTLERFHMQVLSPVPWPVIGYPQAWAQGTQGVVTGEVVYIPYAGPADSVNFAGKVGGKWVMTTPARVLDPRCTPEATRQSDAQLANLANAPAPGTPGAQGGRGGGRGLGNIAAIRGAAACRGETLD